MTNKYAVFAFRALATLSAFGSALVAAGQIPAALSPVFTGIAGACMLLHANPFAVTK